MTTAAVADTPRIYTIEEYLELEERSSLKHHFVQGKLINMPGGTLRHNRIATNIAYAIENALRQQSLPFLVSNSDTKIWVPVIGSFYYPDAVVIYEVPEYYHGRKDVILNPLLIVEVASPSTEAHDRGSKFMDCATLPSMKEFLIVHQDYRVAHLSSRVESDLWQLSTAEGTDKQIYLRSIGTSIAMSDIYYKTEGL